MSNSKPSFIYGDEKRFELLANLSRDVLFDWDIDNDTVWKNTAFNEQYSYSENEIESASGWWLDRVHPDDRNRVDDIVLNATKTASDISFSCKFRRGDQTYVHINVTGRVIARENTAVHIIGSIVDISEVSLLKQRIEESKESLEFALKAADIGTWDLDIKTRVVTWNERCKQLYGYSKDDNVGYESVLALTHPDDEESVRTAVNNALDFASGGVYDIQFRTVGAEDKKIRWLHCKGQAYFNDENQAYRFSGIAQDISEQVEAAKKINDNERMAKVAVEGVGIGTFNINLVDDSIIYSPQLCRIITGRETEDFKRADFFKFIHPDDKTIRELAMHDVMTSGKMSFIARFIHYDQSIHWIKVQATCEFSASKKPLSIIGICQDITSDILLQEEQKKLLSLVENSADYMGIADGDGNVFYINSAGKELVGIDPDVDVRSLNATDFYKSEHFKLISDEVVTSLREKNKWSGEITFSHFKTGEAIPCFANFIGISDPLSGAISLRGATIRDLRPEIASKKALLESEKSFRNLILEAPFPTALYIGKEMKIEIANDEMIKLWGKDSTVIGKTLHEALPELSSQPFHQLLRNVFESGIDYHTDQQPADLVVDGTLQRFWFNFTYRPLHDVNGNVYGIINMAVDLTRQVHLQNLKDEFLGIASHELKTPVTSLKAYTQVLERILKREGDATKIDMVSRMDKQLNRLNSLIGDLLDVTKIQTGKLQFNNSYFDFNTLVSEIVVDLQHTTTKHAIRIVQEEMPEIYADKDKIGQVITNLVENAIKYSPQPGDIVAQSFVKPREVVFRVIDYGIGISKNKQDKVFEQFYRVNEKAHLVYPGLGLGLYISSEIIKRCGGKIWFESEEGRGSTFSFSIPLTAG
ncbi:PAS domain-containing protein [Pedobacter sp. HMF7647]|uniref:histidine kinase n=1 Tax=Hufsiella arboris TaxID=2695275 RepID=A0A7K1Y9S6_9SPHI|nr:PAS domain-containing protein [Hufsiella arboris]MXV51322.1 PAS domain-containing protein [Hufsiella arboris]